MADWEWELGPGVEVKGLSFMPATELSVAELELAEELKLADDELPSHSAYLAIEFTHKGIQYNGHCPVGDSETDYYDTIVWEEGFGWSVGAEHRTGRIRSDVFQSRIRKVIDLNPNGYLSRMQERREAQRQLWKKGRPS